VATTRLAIIEVIDGSNLERLELVVGKHINTLSSNIDVPVPNF
jgi:hypothetical protein